TCDHHAGRSRIGWRGIRLPAHPSKRFGTQRTCRLPRTRAQLSPLQQASACLGPDVTSHSACAMTQATVAGTVSLQRTGTVATVTLSHPGRLNALSVAMWRELARIFDQLSGDNLVHCIVVRGAGGNFSAGADITEFPIQRAGIEA